MMVGCDSSGILRRKRLAANVTDRDAETLLRGSAGWNAPLRTVAEVWLPYYLYEMTMENRGNAMTEVLAIDAVDGSLDLLSVDPAALIAADDRTTNRLPPQLDASTADILLRDKVRRIIFRRGFFRISNLSLKPRRLEVLLYVPYWVGFFGRERVSRIRVVDGVRRTLEGGKLPHLISEWLRQPPVEATQRNSG